MGAIDFYTPATGPDLTTAFNAARSHHRWEHGHSGFTGTVAEKETVALIDEPRRSERAATARAEQLVHADDPRISCKWGPAGALPITTDSGERGWLLFGTASY